MRCRLIGALLLGLAVACNGSPEPAVSPAPPLVESSGPDDLLCSALRSSQ